MRSRCGRYIFCSATDQERRRKVSIEPEELAYLFDERNEAIKHLIRHLIPIAHQARCKVGIIHVKQRVAEAKK